MPPLVSVCVPTFNRAPLLRASLASILHQSFHDFELIVVDDASTDETPGVVAELVEPRLRYERNGRNLGQIGNLNRCLELARGEYVCIFHDDDIYVPTILQREVAVLARHPGVGLVHTAVWMLSADGQVRRVHRVAGRDYVRPGRERFVTYLRRAHDIVFSTAMVRRSCYAAVGPFDPRFILADGDMWLRITLRFDVGYIAEPLAGYRVHDTSASRTMTPARWFGEYFDIFEKNVALAEPFDPSLAARVPSLRAEARRVQARRSRIEAAACIVAGRFDLAEDYLRVASGLDPSPLGRASAAALRACRTPLGRAALGAVRAMRQRIHEAAFDAELRVGRVLLA